jgi:hypothetical protein
MKIMNNRFNFKQLFIKGDCDFEESTLNDGWCLWRNEQNDVFDWTRASGSTPDHLTGPQMAAGTLCKTPGKMFPFSLPENVDKMAAARAY